jgi:hypothetical protein
LYSAVTPLVIELFNKSEVYPNLALVIRLVDRACSLFPIPPLVNAAAAGLIKQTENDRCLLRTQLNCLVRRSLGKKAAGA